METITWSVPEYETRPHTNDWYWGVGLILLVAFGLTVYWGNYLFGVLLIIGIGSLLYFNTRTPREMEITLGERGIKINENLNLYKDIEAFWIEEENALPEGHTRHLLIKTNRRVMPLVAIPLGDVPEQKIKEKLSPVIKLEELSESKTHHLFELLGF